MTVNKNFVKRCIYGKCILMPVKADLLCNDPVCLNDVGEEIWDYATLGLESREIVNRIKNAYNLEDDSMEELAVIKFIQELMMQGILIEDGKVE